MSPFDLNQPTPMPLTEGDQDQDHLAPFSTLTNDTINTLHDQGATDRVHRFQRQPPQPKPYEHQFLIGGSNDHLISFTANNENKSNSINQPPCDVYIQDDEPRGPGEWMSSKMRFMRKMMTNSDHRFILTKQRRNTQVPDQDQSHPTTQEGSTSSNSNTNSPPCGFVRVCSDCNTTKTPLWRSGPRGPKSLCNACGIRQRKARRAMAAAAAASNGLTPTDAPNRGRKEKKPGVDRTVPFKKRCKITMDSTAPNKLRFDDVTIRLSNYSALRHVFPQDEWDAAILLMALSCGLVLS